MNPAASAPMDLVGGAVGLVLTLLAFSYLIGDNSLFRLVLHIFIGVTAGYLATVTIYNVIWPKLIAPLFELSRGSFLAVILPLLMSLLLLAKVSRRFNTLGSPVLAFLVGIGAATAIGGAVIGLIFPQVIAAVNSFDVAAVHQNQENINVALFNAGIILVGTVCSLAYFHFGARAGAGRTAQRPRWIEWLAQIGKGFIIVAFGMIFAGVITAAFVAIIDRFRFITEFLFSIMARFL